MLSLDTETSIQEEELNQRLPKWHKYMKNALSDRGVQIVQLM